MGGEGSNGSKDAATSRALTAEEFERSYAERSGVTVEWLRRYRTVRSCDCDEAMCDGWQSVSHDAAAEIDAGRKVRV